jgi:hypothetical protein
LRGVSARPLSSSEAFFLRGVNEYIGASALHSAAMDGDGVIVAALLKAGAKVN